jgi:hypothetical protein
VIVVCKSGLKVLCFVVVSMENGHFGNSVIFGVVRSCRHGLQVLVLCRGMKIANYSNLSRLFAQIWISLYFVVYCAFIKL